MYSMNCMWLTHNVSMYRLRVRSISHFNNSLTCRQSTSDGCIDECCMCSVCSNIVLLVSIGKINVLPSFIYTNTFTNFILYCSYIINIVYFNIANNRRKKIEAAVFVCVLLVWIRNTMRRSGKLNICKASHFLYFRTAIMYHFAKTMTMTTMAMSARILASYD